MNMSDSKNDSLKQQPLYRPDSRSFWRLVKPTKVTSTNGLQTPNQRFRRSVRLLIMLVKKDFKVRYVGSVMGFLWSVIHPLILMGLYITVFSLILKVKLGDSQNPIDYGLFLMCGMSAWLPLQEILDRSATVLLENSNLIKKVAFPRILLPLAVTISGLINGVIAILLFALAAFFLGRTLTPQLLFIFLILPLQGLFALGLGLAVSSLNLVIRDTAHLVRAATLLWFFATPIVYSMDMAPAGLRFFILLNPLTHVTALYRALLLSSASVSLAGLLYFGLWTLISLSLGWLIFTRAESEFADWL